MIVIVSWIVNSYFKKKYISFLVVYKFFKS